MANAARGQMRLWRERANAKLARFGPQWLAESEVEQRSARAEQLLSQAESADDQSRAKLLQEAAKAHPYRVDIPFAEFRMHYRAERMREASGALGAVLRIDRDHLAALNNAGVLAAGQKQWQVAFAQLSRAAARDSDVAFDNLDQAIEMARADKYRMADRGEEMIAAAVTQLHRADRHKGQTRWGNSWISLEEHKEHVEADRNVDRKRAKVLAAMRSLAGKYSRLRTERSKLRRQMKAYGGNQKNNSTYKRIKSDLNKIDKEVEQIEKKAEELKGERDKIDQERPQPPHAGRLVLLDLDGSTEFASIDAGSKNNDGGGDLFDDKGDDKKSSKKKSRKKAKDKKKDNKKNDDKDDDGDIFD
jgi:hypothetical protein